MEAAVADVFDEETFLPSQYADTRTRRLLTPEQRLQIAVLSQAQKDLRLAKHAEDAAHWFFTVGDSHMYSLNTICESVDKRPKKLRVNARKVLKRYGRWPSASS